MEFLFTFVIFLAVVTIMSVGVMRGRKPISGSCGGLANLGVGGACEICGGDPAKCENESG
ncbi:MAG TPA: (Na+)-NQR maturation NqrM, partial [Pseudomonadales bacterium]|nr:(Na+)-NQR maturation NqrM [Pseudomonadales bacterium]